MNASYTSCASLHGGIDQYDRWFTFTDDPRGGGGGKDEVVRKRGCSGVGKWIFRLKILKKINFK